MKVKATLTILLFGVSIGLAKPTQVARILDGDTFETIEGEKVRLVGINAPEMQDVFGFESKRYLESLIGNKIVELQKDGISSDKDRYGRLLRYVFFQEVDINKKMLNDGFAFAYLKYHFDKEQEYKKTQLIAQENNVGIWGSQSKVEIVNQQNDKENSQISKLSVKKWLIAFLVLVLVLIGGINYFKK